MARTGHRGAANDAFVKAVQSVYEDRLDEFCSVVAAITRDRTGARDVVHDAFAAALRSLNHSRGDGGIGAWIWRIVVNTARDRRGRRELQLSQLTGEATNGAAPHRAAAADDRLAEAIQALPRAAAACDLPPLLRRSRLPRQIGDELGIATGTVSAALNAAHRSLTRQLNEVHG